MCWKGCKTLILKLCCTVETSARSLKNFSAWLPPQNSDLFDMDCKTYNLASGREILYGMRYIISNT